MTQPIAIEAEGLCKHYGAVKALDNVGFQVESGQMLALLGHNGAGKTTLIKLILGLLTPDAGQIRVQGLDPAIPGHRPKLSLGYLPEHVSLYGNLSGEESLNYFADLRRVPRQRVAELLDALHLTDAARRPVRTYSKGMRQRLALAQAVLAKPKVLLLDEPTVGLDPQTSEYLYGYVNSLVAEGCAVILCTHELTLVEPHFDRALVLANGQILASGTLEELRAQPGLHSRIGLARDTLALREDRALAPFLTHGGLLVPQSAVEGVVERLTHHHRRFDLTVSAPSLAQIYQHCQQEAR